MRDSVLALLGDLDVVVATLGVRTEVDITVIGGAAIALTLDAQHATRDVDLVGPLQPEVAAAVMSAFGGAQTLVALDVDWVGAGLPPMALGWRARRAAVEPGRWRALAVWVPAPIDLALSKLRRFLPRDRQDIERVLGAAEVGPDEFDAACASWCVFEADWKEKAQPHIAAVLAWLRGDTGHIVAPPGAPRRRG